MGMLNFEFKHKPLTQADIDYQERRGNYWSTSMQNVVKGSEPDNAVKGWIPIKGMAILSPIAALVYLLFYFGVSE